MRTMGVGVLAGILVVVAAVGFSTGMRGVPGGGRPASQATFTADPYPGGTAGFSPTPTAISTAQQKYSGWTGEEIADDLIALIVATPDPWSSESPTYQDSAEINSEDADALGMRPSAISHQSPTDMAVILGGSFTFPGWGTTLATPAPVDYVLLVVDTYSGAIRLRVESNSLSELQGMLP